MATWKIQILRVILDDFTQKGLPFFPKKSSAEIPDIKGCKRCSRNMIKFGQIFEWSITIFNRKYIFITWSIFHTSLCFFRIMAVPQKLLRFHTALTPYENAMFEANEFGWIFQWVFWVGGNSETKSVSQQVHDLTRKF